MKEKIEIQVLKLRDRDVLLVECNGAIDLQVVHQLKKAIGKGVGMFFTPYKIEIK